MKREIKKLAQDECGYEEPTVAMAFVYFEKLVLQGKLNKQNRKLCAGACVLLAAKIGGDLKKHEVKLLIDVSPPVDRRDRENDDTAKRHSNIKPKRGTFCPLLGGFLPK